ncbi:hypothetical protein GCM10012290_15770 [Halolactibacillus alkaliphilus]|uniref:Spore coat protein CotO n=1 Tax=Halolactibacillus alkaliphilus TaxID=442899 RepID=A0A511X1G6_9BACI|nr:hypothetical protein [Halolactibacillus alkaliphilus]GEN56788.1 hypothetical protein HAL01_12520 [Halolactibacillus alkaliphilus]GGN71167.1 hypothetical protein GCM10012290_15770 [Halolactibacillus alkaliphilus]SFO81265.1 hypothetical protein SAMN05720591_11351 [Halolactibacillus alkaliphilus]
MPKRKITLSKLETLEEYVSQNDKQQTNEDIPLRALSDPLLASNTLITDIDALLKPSMLSIRHEIKVVLKTGDYYVGIPVQRDDDLLTIDTGRKNTVLSMTDIDSFQIIGIK